MITGQELREFREKRSVRPVDLANAMNIDRQRIGQIEKQGEVGRDVAERFLTGVLLATGDLVPGDNGVELQVTAFAQGEAVATW